MVEQLIGYEVAKLAKKKGFNTTTKMCYGRYFPQLSFDNLHEAEHFNGDFSSYAPTQSLLQKWLREAHKIHIEVNWFADNTWEYWLVSDFLEDEEDDLIYNSYEEALEKALLEALGTIK